MKKYILKKQMFAIVFLAVVFGFSIINCYKEFPALVEKGKELFGDGNITKQDVADFETSITENCYGRMNFIETFALAQTVLDKRECNNFTYIKDEEGFLHYASFYREEDADLFEYALRVKRLKDCVEANGTKVLFVVPPGKYDKEATVFRTGMPVNDPNWIVDEMLIYKNRLGIDTLDFRKKLPNERLSYEETFFKTDHHWTIPAAFEATCEIVDTVE